MLLNIIKKKTNKMPCNYSNYPKYWKSQIVPDILKRAENRCEICRAQNGIFVFRGKIDWNLENIEVYQDHEGNIYKLENGEFLETNFLASIEPLSGSPNQKAVKIVLTIAHLDHDTSHNDYSNLKALCQLHHNRYDAQFRAKNRKKNIKQTSLF